MSVIPGAGSSNTTDTSTPTTSSSLTTITTPPGGTTSITSTPTSISTSTSTTPPDTPTTTTTSSSSSSSRSSTSPTSLTSSSTPFISTPTTSPTPTPILKTSTTVVTPSVGTPTTIVKTITTEGSQPSTSDTATGAATSSTASASAVGSTGSQSGSSGGASPSIVAPAVIVPVIGIALLVVLGIFFWRRRKQRQEAAEMRQKEMEEYSYNPNSDPTIPAVGAVSSNGDDQSGDGGGYRGWGTTSSAGPRKASTTLGGTSSPGAIGIARSDSSGHGYDDHSPHALSTEGNEGIASLGAGPLAGNNRGQGVNRGVSNASSAYSGGQRSDGSDNAAGGFAGSPQQYYDELMQPDDGVHDGYGQPVIREVSARRNTRIENPAIYPQHGNAGIAQNF